MEELAELVPRPIPTGPYDTVAGLYLYVAGKIPRPDETATINGVNLRVMAMDRLRIARLTVWMDAPTDGETPTS